MPRTRMDWSWCVWQLTSRYDHALPSYCLVFLIYCYTCDFHSPTFIAITHYFLSVSTYMKPRAQLLIVI